MSYQSSSINGQLAVRRVTTVSLTELALGADLDLTSLGIADSGKYYGLQASGALRNVHLPVNPPNGFMITIANRGLTYMISTMRDGNPIYNIGVGDSLTLIYGTLFGYYFV